MYNITIKEGKNDRTRKEDGLTQLSQYLHSLFLLVCMYLFIYLLPYLECFVPVKMIRPFIVDPTRAGRYYTYFSQINSHIAENLYRDINLVKTKCPIKLHFPRINKYLVPKKNTAFPNASTSS